MLLVILLPRLVSSLRVVAVVVIHVVVEVDDDNNDNDTLDAICY